MPVAKCKVPVHYCVLTLLPYDDKKLTILCWVPFVGSQHDASRICCWVPAPAAWRPQCARSYRSISPVRSPPASVAAVDLWNRQTDGRTDGRTSDRYRAPRSMQAAYIMISVEFVDIDECADPTICAVGITILPCVNTYGNYTCLELTPSLRKCSTFVHLSMRIWINYVFTTDFWHPFAALVDCGTIFGRHACRL